MTTIMISPKS